MQESYSLKRVHTINNILYLSQFIASYLFLIYNETFQCDGYIYFLTVYETVFTLMLNGCFLMRFICAPLQGYPQEKLSQSIIGYCFPLAMSITHIVCCCGLFDSINNHLLYRKTNTSQIISTMITFIIMVCILCTSNCIAQTFTYHLIIFYISIAIVHISFGFNSYLISHRKIKDALHGFTYYMAGTCMICIEITALLFVLLNWVYIQIDDEYNSYLKYNGLIWIFWYFFSMPFIFSLSYWYYVRQLFNSMIYVNMGWNMINKYVPLINWLSYKSYKSYKIQSNIITDKIYSTIHAMLHLKHKNMNVAIQNNEYIELPIDYDEKSVIKLSQHTMKGSQLCLKYQLQYIKLNKFAERMQYIKNVSCYDGIISYKFVICFMFKIILQFYPIFWFVYGYIYIDNSTEFYFIEWINRDFNKCQNLIFFVLICFYTLSLLILILCGYKVIICEYYYGFIRRIMMEKQGQQNRIYKLNVNGFYEGLLLKRTLMDSLKNAGFMYDVCCIILTYLFQQ